MLYLSGKQYFRHVESGEEKIGYETITGGIILTKFDEKEGYPISNGCYKIFVTEENLKKEWEQFEFKVDVNLTQDRMDRIVEFCRKLHTECNQYGAFEDGQEDFEEIESQCKILEDIFKKDFIRDKKHLESYINDAIRQEFNEDMSDELRYGEGSTFYFLIYDLKEEIKKVFVE